MGSGWGRSGAPGPTREHPIRRGRRLRRCEVPHDPRDHASRGGDDLAAPHSDSNGGLGPHGYGPGGGPLPGSLRLHRRRVHHDRGRERGRPPGAPPHRHVAHARRERGDRGRHVVAPPLVHRGGYKYADRAVVRPSGRRAPGADPAGIEPLGGPAHLPDHQLGVRPVHGRGGSRLGAAPPPARGLRRRRAAARGGRLALGAAARRDPARGGRSAGARHRVPRPQLHSKRGRPAAGLL